jgi:inner membrane protein
MLGNTHTAVGIAATLAVTRPDSLSELILAVGMGTVGALISDIDVGTSESHKEADRVVAFTILGVLAVIGFDHFLNTGIIAKVIQNSGYIRIAAGIALFVGVCAFGKEQPHRSFMHSFLALFLLGFALGLVWEKAVIYFAVGFLSHLVMDIFNFRKVRLFYPAKVGFSLKLCYAHGTVNTVCFGAASVVAVAELLFFGIRIVM